MGVEPRRDALVYAPCDFCLKNFDRSRKTAWLSKVGSLLLFAVSCEGRTFSSFSALYKNFEIWSCCKFTEFSGFSASWKRQKTVLVYAPLVFLRFRTVSSTRRRPFWSSRPFLTPFRVKLSRIHYQTCREYRKMLSSFTWNHTAVLAKRKFHRNP